MVNKLLIYEQKTTCQTNAGKVHAVYKNMTLTQIVILLIVVFIVVVSVILAAFWPDEKPTPPPIPPLGDLPEKFHDEPFKKPACANFIPAHTKPPATAFHWSFAQAEIKGGLSKRASSDGLPSRRNPPVWEETKPVLHHPKKKR